MADMKKQNKTRVFMFRLTADEFKYLKLKALSAGVKVSKFIRSKLFGMGWRKEADLLKAKDKEKG